MKAKVIAIQVMSAWKGAKNGGIPARCNLQHAASVKLGAKNEQTFSSSEATHWLKYLIYVFYIHS